MKLKKQFAWLKGAWSLCLFVKQQKAKSPSVFGKQQSMVG
jgi:hypothetical protein